MLDTGMLHELLYASQEVASLCEHERCLAICS